MYLMVNYVSVCDGVFGERGKVGRERIGRSLGHFTAIDREDKEKLGRGHFYCFGEMFWEF